MSSPNNKPFTWHQLLPCAGPTEAEVRARRSAICALAIDATKLWPIDYHHPDKDCLVDPVWLQLTHAEDSGEPLGVAEKPHIPLDVAIKVATKMIRRKHLPIPIGSPDAKRYREAAMVVCYALYALKTDNPAAQLRALQSAMTTAEACGVDAMALAEIALIAARPCLKPQSL